MFRSTHSHATGVVGALNLRAAALLAPVLALLMTIGLLASPAAQAAGPRPPFQMPFACGQTWEASTYGDDPTTSVVEDHGGDGANANAIDLGQFQTSGDKLSNISAGQPIVASAAGIAENADVPANLYGWIDINHGYGWKTRYLNLKGSSPVENGDHVAQGEVIGYVGEPDSGTRTASTSSGICS